jgi:chitin disaccharide deacetylase
LKRLIVNADDFGRTPGVNAGTLQACLHGIVTSATVMILESAAKQGIREAISLAPSLDLGLHVVLTGGGSPASPAAEVPTLAPGGRFARDAGALPARLPAEEVRREIEAQLSRFESVAGRLPSHLDSHHHAARHPDIEPVFAAAARERGLPVRLSNAAARERLRQAGLQTPDTFLDGFYAEGATTANLFALLESLSEGSSELMCHPGFPDEALLAGSSYGRERALEVEALCDPRIRALLARLGVRLLRYSEL